MAMLAYEAAASQYERALRAADADLGYHAAAGARERILTSFPMERRREGILRVVEEAFDG